MAACGSSIGHSECNFTFVVVERVGHKAPPDAWRNGKKKLQKKRK